jgi:hypothetical protein
MLKFYCVIAPLIITATGQVATATPILDQSQLSATGQQIIIDGRGQSFTVGVAGILHSIEVYLDRNSASGDIEFEVRTTTPGGKPVTDPTGLLFRQVIDVASLPELIGTTANPPPSSLTIFDVSSATIAVTPGDVLAFTVRGIQDEADSVSIGLSTSNPYAGGERLYRNSPGGIWLSNTWDQVFRTYVVAESFLPGDLDNDGFVGITDLNIVLGNWNQNVTTGDPLSGDPSGDGFVGIEDLNTVLGNWNAGTPPTESVIPEPGVSTLLLIGSLTLLRRNNRHV